MGRHNSRVVATPKTQWKRPRASRVRAIRERLRVVYGTPRMEPHGDPLGELILTVLSQSTNDRNRDVAFDRLREMVGPWEAVLAAPVSEIEEAIKPGGISKVKSVRIKAILEAIARDNPASGLPFVGPTAPGECPVSSESPHGDLLSLDWMREAPIEESREFLCALPGVGRKTAACVLLFSYGLHDVPVDTHVSRVGWRLGLFRPGASFDELHDEMLQITPVGAELELHVNMLRHGRRTCFARSPACAGCALRRMCPSASEFLSAARKPK
jgi:endonuclease-3